MSSLTHAEEDTLEARNPSKGCGAVMRVAPVALYTMPLACGDEFKHAEAFRLAMALAGITHGHPTARYASGVLASLILGILQGDGIEAALDRAMALLRQHESRGEIERAIEAARSLADRGVPAAEAIPQLGEGWVSEEALAIAVYCALSSPDYEAGVCAAVNIDGDSDSTGSITGQILGALHGEEAIPTRWLEELELREVIGSVADDFLRLHERSEATNTGDYWLERYPPG